MVIDFACTCGREFHVPEAHAGKRTKCPGCSHPLTVPTLPKAESLTEEDAAYRALSEGPEPEPSNRDWREPNASAPAFVPTPRTSVSPQATPSATPKKKKRKAAEHDPYAPKERQWNVDWGTVTGGILGVIGGGALLLGGLAFDRFFIWSPIIIIGGLFGIINGLLNKS